MLDLLWFQRSLRTQILLVFLLIELLAALIAGGVIVIRAGASTRIEMAASFRLSELMVGEAVQLVQKGVATEQFLNTLPGQLRFVRHVRIGVRDATGIALPSPARERAELPGEAEHATAPAWFARLIALPIRHQEVPITVNGRTIGTVAIASEPQDEIAEVWGNVAALAAITITTALLMAGILFFALGRVLDPLRALDRGLRGLERRDYKLRIARPKVLEFAGIADRSMRWRRRSTMPDPKTWRSIAG